MLKYYIKTAFRNFRSNKIIFGGSILTLCLGALCISLLFSYVHNEMTMDDFHTHKDDVYMVIMKTSPKSEWQYPYSFNAKEYPEIRNSTAIINFREEELKFIHDQNTFTPEGIVADSSFFKVLDFDLIIGDKNNILKDYQAVILSKKFSQKIFGMKNPIGEQIVVKGRVGEDIHIVKGIVEVPANSSLKFDYILPNNGDESKYSRGSVPFILTAVDFDMDAFNARIEEVNNNVPYVFPKLTESKTKIVSLSDLYFNKDLAGLKKQSFISTGNKITVYILMVIMLILLLISALNFSNLQIIGANSTVKNMAVSRVFGASLRNIHFKKITEIAILIFLAAVLISCVFIVALPYFTDFVGVPLEPPAWKIFLINSSILVLIALLGLIYPAILSTRISITNSLKKQIQLCGDFRNRKVVVVFQYLLTFVLLISSIVVARQLHLMLNKDLGFSSHHVVEAKLYYEPPFNRESRNWTKEQREAEHKKRQEIPQYVNNTLAKMPSIREFAQGESPLETFQIDWKLTKDLEVEYKALNSLVVTPGYSKVLGLDILEGRFFNKVRDKERGQKIVINQAAKEFWGITDFEAVEISNRSWGGDKKTYDIIGVVKDFNYEHLSVKPKPLVMVYFDDAERDYLIQFQDGQVEEGIRQIHSLFNEINPNQTFKYSFLDDEIAALYQKEKRLSIIYILFTIIALFISAIGLFTIALYDTRRRMKEIAIRKVNGAKVSEILSLLNKSFIKWVGFAFVIACPIAYLAMQKWLENFAYKTDLSWWIFAVAGIVTLLIALLTVSWQSYRAAIANPAIVLQDE